MANILLVEDCETHQKIVGKTLAHLNVTIVDSAEAALKMVQEQEFDLILLDINLPGKNGYQFLSELEENSKSKGTPVICLTGKTDVTDKVTAFSLGADDYIVKPFDPIELRARVDGKLSKASRASRKSDLLVVGDLEIDHARHRVSLTRDGKKLEVKVTQTEFKLLSCLAKRPEQVFTRDQLLVAAWGEDATVLDRAVDVHLCSLRKKLIGISHCIEAVQGVGYRFCLEKAVQFKVRTAA